MLRDYVNTSEREQLLFLSELFNVQQKVINEWSKRGTLDKKELKMLRTSRTLLNQFFDKFLNRLNDKCLKTVSNAMKKTSIVMHDNYSMEQYKKKKESDINAGYENSLEYFNLVETVFDNNCKDCTKKCTECSFYTLFEQSNIPDMGYNIGNCRFAYKSVNIDVTIDTKKVC